MIYLPDVNVWIALTSDQHVHHTAAKRWIQNLEADRLAFCRITELGFLRLLTNHHVMGGGALVPAQAWDIYDVLRDDPQNCFYSGTTHVQQPLASNRKTNFRWPKCLD